MVRVLHIQSSPRGAESVSARVAQKLLQTCTARHAEAEIDTLDLFAENLPTFDAPAAAAKYAVMGGETPTDKAQDKWAEVIAVVDRFKAADTVVISSPMWNFGIPYRLKHYVDLLVQPGLTFSVDQDGDYSGLATGRPAVLVLARGGQYGAGSPMAAYDMQRPYLENVLRLIGFEDIHTIIAEPTLAAGPERAEAAVAAAIAEADRVAGLL